jgi:hypothetical protein
MSASIKEKELLPAAPLTEELTSFYVNLGRAAQDAKIRRLVDFAIELAQPGAIWETKPSEEILEELGSWVDDRKNLEEVKEKLAAQYFLSAE